MLTYEYYENGNLKAVYEDNVKQVSYVYDEYNRLTEEKNYRLGEGWICEYGEVMTSGAVDYNKGGNIVSRRRYVLENGNFGAEMEHFLYGYYSGNAETNTMWHDQLKTMNGGIVKYDKAGNSTYLLGRTYEWRGRRLIKAYDVEMEYDAAGLRTKKGNTVYFWQGDRLVREKTGEEEIYYYYDESGVSGINYNGKEYYFRKNMLGDVIAIYASNGALQCRYAYSAWGGHEIYDASGNKITGGDNIGIKNPIRYRGYYYDRELYLYYLQSRYYEPILGRFLSPDSPQYLDPTTIQGLNLYTYCLNNPISYVDPSGNVVGVDIFSLFNYEGRVWSSGRYKVQTNYLYWQNQPFENFSNNAKFYWEKFLSSLELNAVNYEAALLKITDKGFSLINLGFDLLDGRIYFGNSEYFGLKIGTAKADVLSIDWSGSDIGVTLVDAKAAALTVGLYSTYLDIEFLIGAVGLTLDISKSGIKVGISWIFGFEITIKF